MTTCTSSRFVLKQGEAQSAPLLLKPAAVAVMLGIGRSKVYELIGQGVIPVVKLGPRCTRIPVEGLIDALKVPHYPGESPADQKELRNAA